ncbi:MAG TPA: uracil-DNA glycosylase [Gammaproteobacteria bacterium]|nr:uracil-DNA glycosylase [Gammaproteobacteria bacterium]
MSSLQDQYLQAMGIQRWQRRSIEADPAIPAMEQTCMAVSIMQGGAMATHKRFKAPADTPNISSADILRLDWQALERAVSVCTRCRLHETRTQTVFGVGNRRADWMVIGEAPGAEEDRQGEPFVGRAGQLLNAMLKAIGLAREEVYIANILKSRPPHNRDPLPDEVAACEPYLLRQIELVQPKIILAVGRIAAQNLLKTDTKIGLLRGKRHTYPGTAIPLVVTYHPAYLLRAPAEKRKAWEDLQFARRVLKGEV